MPVLGTMAVATTVMTAAAIAAAVRDVRTRRIPNLLTASLALFGLAVAALQGAGALGSSALALLVVFLAGTLAFSAGWFGGGDVKLIAACAAVVGMQHLVLLLSCIGMTGGVVVIAYVLRKRMLRTTIASTFGTLSGRAPISNLSVPYGIAIAAGCGMYSVLSLLAPT